MERVLYNLHSKACGEALRRSSSKSRYALEFGVLLLSMFGFGVLIVSHWSFVFREGAHNIPASCLKQVPGFDNSSDIIHIALINNEEQINQSSFAHDSTPSATACTNEDYLLDNDADALVILAKSRIRYSFSQRKGLLLLESTRGINVTSQTLYVSKRDVACFGEPFLQKLVFWIVGTDTVIKNWLVILGSGFAYNPTTQSFVEIPRIPPARSSSSSWTRYIWSTFLWKAGVVATSIFLFFITTTLTSFTLGETQQRMLEFTLQLQEHVREERNLGRLVFLHVMENLVFVPIMVGMMFFLIEFYGGDNLLAFFVLSGVWICEVFSVVSLRSKEGLLFFPKIFFFLFLGFHIYLFSCPLGFHYTALAAAVAFLIHSMILFWNRFELPAIANGLVTMDRPRMSQHSSSPLDAQQQQTGITSYPSVSTLGQSIFQQDEDEDGFMYMLNGEVVMPQVPQRITLDDDETSRRRTTTSFSEESSSPMTTNRTRTTP